MPFSDSNSALTYVFNEGTLVLEGVTLAELVELVVEVLVDLASGTVLDQETAEDTEASHPEDLTVHFINQNCSPPISFPRLTQASEHPLFPFSYHSHGVCQFFGPG
jgi:hypothetical protein